MDLEKQLAEQAQVIEEQRETIRSLRQQMLIKSMQLVNAKDYSFGSFFNYNGATGMILSTGIQYSPSSGSIPHYTLLSYT